MMSRTKYLHLSALMGAVLLAGYTSRADYPAEVLSLGPLNYWRFSETGVAPPAITAANAGSLGAAGNGTYVGNLRGFPGAIKSETTTAAKFPGNNNRVTSPYDATTMGTSTFTVEAWVRPAVSPPPSGQSSLAAVLSCGQLAAPRTGWLIYQAAGGWNLRGYNGVDSATSISITGGPAPVADTWYHIAATFDGSIAKVYVNGVQTAISGAVTTYAPNGGGVFSIGTRSDVAFPYNGDVDEVAYYAKTLDAATIAAHYAAGTNASPPTPYANVITASGPALYFRLNEAPYVAMESANLGSRGTNANASYAPVMTTAAGPRPPVFPAFDAANTAVTLDGAANSMDCGTNSSLAGTTDFSIVTWVKTTLNTANGVIIQQRDVDGIVPGYNGEYKLSMNADGTVQFMLYKDDYQFNYATTATINDGNWHQVAVVRKGLDGFTYIDGVPVASATGTLVRELVPLIKTFIGRDMRDFIEPWSGQIDEVAIFDKALGAGTMASLYYTGIGSNAPPTLATDPPTVTPEGTIYATTPFSIASDVSGALPITYEWRRNGTVVGTEATFHKATASQADNGAYQVVAKNAYGSVTSSVVNITVNAAVPPQITQQPATRPVYSGGNASFSVEATGTAPLAYQWKRAGTNIAGATTSRLVITNVTPADIVAYSVTVTNVAGTTTSQNANLTLRTPAAGSYEAAVVASGPIAYWRLGEKTGSLVLDYLGGNDGVATNVVLAQPGYSTADTDTAVAFDPSQTPPSVIDAAGMEKFLYTGSAPTFSLEVWGKFNDFTALQRVFSKGGPANSGIGFGVRNETSMRFTTYGVQDFDLTLPITLTPNTWYHIVGVATGGNFRFYIDGQLMGSVAFTGAGVAPAGNPPFAIGRNGLGTAETVNGLLDEAAVYNRALTAEEVANHYAVGKFGATTPVTIVKQPASQTGFAGKPLTLDVAAEGSVPVRYQWKKGGTAIPGATSASLSFASLAYSDAGDYTVTLSNNVNTVTSSTAALSVVPQPTFANLTNGLVLHLTFNGDYRDTSGRGNDASAPSGNPGFIAGPVGQALRVNTTPNNNYLVVSDNQQDLTFDENVSFSVALWLKFTGTFNDHPIIGNAVNSTWQLGWVITEQNPGIEYSLVSTANTDTYIGYPPSGIPAINNGAWHHVLCVVDRTAQKGSVYVDGMPAQTWSLAGLGTLASGNPLTIGQDPTGGYGTANFDLDDIGIWRKALTAYDAMAIYNAGALGSSFNTYGPVKITVGPSAPGSADLIIAWQAGTLEATDDISNAASWAPVQGAAAPTYKVTPGTGKKFYRVKL